jgi:GNAT superfamily N-acetyltransferase
MRIRLGDWRDHHGVQTLRKETLGSGGGLYELLTWPVYHVHTAIDGGDRVVGFTSVALFPDGTADDCGTVVAEDHRERGIGSALRATQVRDLLVMGWRTLYVAVPTPNEAGVACAKAHFGEALGVITAEGLPPVAYFGGPLAEIQARLTRAGAFEPRPLSPPNADKLRQKAEAARNDLAKLAAQGTLTVQKAQLRASVALHG